VLARNFYHLQIIRDIKSLILPRVMICDFEKSAISAPIPMTAIFG